MKNKFVQRAVTGILFVAVLVGGILYSPVTFGVLFMLLAVSNAIYHFRNAKKKNRDSLYDITDSAFEEQERTHDAFVPTPESHYCPYCGTPLVDGARYCQNCGQKIR